MSNKLDQPNIPGGRDGSAGKRLRAFRSRVATIGARHGELQSMDGCAVNASSGELVTDRREVLGHLSTCMIRN